MEESEADLSGELKMIIRLKSTCQVSTAFILLEFHCSRRGTGAGNRVTSGERV